MSSQSSPSQRGFQPSEIEAAVASMLLEPLDPRVYPLLARYLEILSRWNQKMNLTAVRDPRLLLHLHLGECLRASQRIPREVETVLDFGSGAGFPGIPMQIIRPELRVTLADSQQKKASFLREVVREVGLSGAQVYAGRVEDMPPTSVFDLVALRAVDNMEAALRSAVSRIRSPQEKRPGWCIVLTSRSEMAKATSTVAGASGGDAIEWEPADPVPGTEQRVILLGLRFR
ncbi:MAG: 16S rRNA (guanine(527)-N(7))-methyltransferase RsmG [Acidobacteriota bacterium]